MRISGSIRFWRWQGAGAMVALAFCMSAAFCVSAGADTTTTSTKKPAQTNPSHATKSHSAASHSATSKTATHTTSHTKSSTAKTNATTAKAQTAHTTSKSAASHTSHGKRTSKKTAKKRGQQVIDSDRAREIQEALIREHYLTGEPTGTWDSSTQAAMQRYQADQGWQNKTTPDSRALIKLGLGPSNDHLLNPESAMTSAPPISGDPTPKIAPKLPAESNPQPAADSHSSPTPNHQPQR